MLDDLEEDMDAAHAKMNFVMGKIGKLLKTKSAFYPIYQLYLQGDEYLLALNLHTLCLVSHILLS